MPLRLDIPIHCAVKEIELLHETLVKGLASRDTTTNERLVKQLYETVCNLNLQVRCVCYEPTCRYWVHNNCRCSGDQRCLGLGYLTRPTRERENDALEAEMRMAESALTESDKARKPDEPFIVWKVRIAYRVNRMANQIHNAPEKGATQWHYDSWRTESPITRTHNFNAFIVRIRALPLEERPTGMDVTQVVGCSVCNYVYVDMESLETHVDRLRFNGHSLHSNAEAITDTTHERVRETSPDYRPPIPTFEPDPYGIPIPPEPEEGPESSDGHEGLLDRLYREDEEDDDQYRERLSDYIRNYHNSSHLYDVVGCSHCGRIFRNGFDYYGHASSNHNMTAQRARDNLVQ